MHATWTSSGAVLLFATASCAQLWGFDEGTLASSVADAGAETPIGPDADADLPVDLTLPVPAACEARAVVADGLFVDAAASAANEACTAAEPCRSIQRALSLVTATRRAIYVGRGSYDENLQVLPAALGADLRIEGRWERRGDAWTPYCAPEADLQIVGTLEVGARDQAPDAGELGSLELAYVGLRGRPPQGEQRSGYGIVARQARVVLVGSRVVAARGQDGFSASESDRPAAATDSLECSSAAGAAGQAGAALGPGTYTSDGFVAASTPNRAAGPGEPGSCAQCTRSGRGGAPGVNGGGGGASVAAYLWNALLEVTEGSTLVAQGGGTGGNGGPGGLGAPGECTQPSLGGTGGTGSPGAGGPTACIVQAGPRSGSLGATSETCTLPSAAAAGGAGGEGVRAAAGVLAVID